MQHIWVEKDITHLSLSVLPGDHFVPETYPIGAIKIDLNETRIDGIKNNSGYHNFLDLEDGTYTVRIETDYYLTKEFEITIPGHGSPPGGAIYSDDEDVQLQDYQGVLVATVTLRPKPSYPFPGGSNLIRGIVYDSGINPLPDAVVRVVGKSIHTRTTENGEFALYFTRLTEYDVIKIGDKKFVKGNGTQEIKIEAEHPDSGISPQVSLELEEGTTTSTYIFYPAI